MMMGNDEEGGVRGWNDPLASRITSFPGFGHIDRITKYFVSFIIVVVEFGRVTEFGRRRDSHLELVSWPLVKGFLPYFTFM